MYSTVICLLFTPLGPDHLWCASGNALTYHCACVSTWWNTVLCHIGPVMVTKPSWYGATATGPFPASRRRPRLSIMCSTTDLRTSQAAATAATRILPPRKLALNSRRRTHAILAPSTASRPVKPTTNEGYWASTRNSEILLQILLRLPVCPRALNCNARCNNQDTLDLIRG